MVEKSDSSTWSNAQLKVILTPLKTKNDGAMPIVKKKLLEAYEAWKNRPPPPLLVAPEVVPLQAVRVFYDVDAEEDHNLLTNEEEAVAAMMYLGASSVV